MAQLSQKSMILFDKISEWQQQIQAYAKSFKDVEIKCILIKVTGRKIKESDNFKNFMHEASNVLSQLTSVNFNDENIEVIILIFDGMKVTSDLSEFVACNFSKTALSIIMKNQEIVKHNVQILLLFIENLVILIEKWISTLNSPLSQRVTILLLGIILKLKKVFPRELSNNVHISKLNTTHKNSFADYEEINKLIEELNITEKNDEENYENLFKEENSLDFYIKLGQQVTKNSSINSVMSPQIKSNLCCQLLMILSKKFNDSKSCDNEALTTALNLITSPKLSNENFKFIESFIVNSMINREEDFWLGVFCSALFIEFISQIENDKLILSYFDIFQKLFIQSKNSPKSLQQQRIAFILKFLYKNNTNLCFEKVRYKEIDAFLHTHTITPNKNINDEFSLVFQEIKNKPNSENFLKLLNSIKNVNIDSFDFDNFKDFCELLKLLKYCEDSKFSTLITYTLEAIKNSNNIEMKMLMLMKIQDLIDKELPFEVNAKILEVLSSFLPYLSSSANLKGLSDLIDNSLDKILNENYALRRVWFNLMKNCEDKIKGKYAIEENVTIPENYVS